MTRAIGTVETNIKIFFKEVARKANDLFTRIWSAVKGFFTECAARLFNKQPSLKKEMLKTVSLQQSEAVVLNGSANALTSNQASTSSIKGAVEPQRSVSNRSAERSPSQTGPSQSALIKDKEQSYECSSYVGFYGSKPIKDHFLPQLDSEAQEDHFLPQLDSEVQERIYAIFPMLFLWDALEKEASFSVTASFIDDCEQQIKTLCTEAADQGSIDVVASALEERMSKLDLSPIEELNPVSNKEDSNLVSNQEDSNLVSTSNLASRLSEKLLSFAREIKTTRAVAIFCGEKSFLPAAFVLIDKRNPEPLFYIIGSFKALSDSESSRLPPPKYVGHLFIRVTSKIDEGNLQRCLEGLDKPFSVQPIVKKPPPPKLDTPVNTPIDTSLGNSAAFVQFNGSKLFSHSNMRFNDDYLTFTMLSLWKRLEEGDFLDQNNAGAFIDKCRQEIELLPQNQRRKHLEENFGWFLNQYGRSTKTPEKTEAQSEINDSLLRMLNGQKTILGSLVDQDSGQQAGAFGVCFTLVDNRGPEPIFYLGRGALNNVGCYPTISVFRKQIDFSKIKLGKAPYNIFLFKKNYINV